MTTREVLPPLEEAPGSSIDLSLAEAWGAVRRAAAAAMNAFEETGGGGNELGNGAPKDGEGGEEVEHRLGNLQLCEDCDCQAVAVLEQPEAEYSDVTARSSMGDPVSWDDSNVSSSQHDSLQYPLDDLPECSEPEERQVSSVRENRKSVEETFTSNDEQEHDGQPVLPESARPNGCSDTAVLSEKPAATQLLQESAESDGSSDTAVLSEKAATTRPVKVDPALAARLFELRTQFNLMFEQNGGADCIASVKQIGDDALIGMRDSAHLDERVMAELDDAKLILDDALRRLDAAVRSKVSEKHPEYADAAAAAEAVVDETKENAGSSSERAKGLIIDGSRLLAG